jgi:hypothetical protein
MHTLVFAVEWACSDVTQSAGGFETTGKIPELFFTERDL